MLLTEEEFWFKRQKEEKERKRTKYRRLNPFILKKQILFVGSSLMAYFPIDELQFNYNLSKRIYNRGIAGFTMSEFEESLEECVFDLDPSKIFINIGTNDMNASDFDLKKFIANYERILLKIKDRLPDSVIYLMAYYPVNFDVALPHIKNALLYRTNERISLANKEVLELANRLGLNFININSAITDEKGNLKKEYSMDGMHFHPDGYNALMPDLIPYLN